jgi:hypothetical protein
VLQALLFLGVALSVLGLIHYYLWRKLVRATTSSKRARRIGTWITIGLTLLVMLTFFGEDALHPEQARFIAWPGYIWLAVMFYLFVVLLVLELPAWIGRLLIRRGTRTSVPAREPALVGVLAAAGDLPPGGDVPSDDAARIGDASPPGGDITGAGAPTEEAGEPDRRAGLAQSRRLFLARTVAIAAGVASVGLVGSGVGAAIGPPRIKRIQIPLAKLGPSASGTRIALVSDIHLGPLIGIDHTRRVVDLVNGLDPDAVAIVGDLVDGSVEVLGPAVAPLADLQSRYGTFFVTGNHEYFSGYEQWIEELPRHGLRLLRNERVELPGGLDLAGVNDVNGSMFGDGPNLATALDGRDLSRPVVLLAHQPILAGEAAEHGVDLQLSGHTHGGQIVPFNLLVRATGQPIVSGLGEVDGMPVYVTNGAGFWGPPVRVGAPPDITLVELVAKS